MNTNLCGVLIFFANSHRRQAHFSSSEKSRFCTFDTRFVSVCAFIACLGYGGKESSAISAGDISIRYNEYN